MASVGQGPLCPDLYERLVDRFGEVNIMNEGEEIKASPRIDPGTGHSYWEIDEKGEHYFVNCPFCNDTRKRLGISYCYGQVDVLTGRAATWMAHCFNEECLSRETPFGLDNRAELEDMIFGFINREDRIGAFPTKPGYASPKKLTDVVLPGKVVTLDRLTGNHPAVQYLESRGVDAARLGAEMGVGFCVEADAQWPAARGRIIIPIVMDGKLVGWQGRYPGDLKWKAAGVSKYYNLPKMPKSLMLYNLDRASKGRLVVLVESVTSVWSIGDQGAALLGHDVSAQQKELLENRWAKKGSLLIMILDTDAEKAAQRHFADLEKVFTGYEKGAAFRIRMTDNKDPGDYDREAVWWMLRQAGRERGIEIDDYL